MESTIKVSFDFDDTLSYQSVQRFATYLISDEIDVHITTSRYEDITRYKDNENGDLNNDDLFKVADRLGITRENIHFTDMEDKADWFNLHKELDFKFHLDNDKIEVMLINSNTYILGIDITISNWKEKCLKTLQTWSQPLITT